MITGVKTQIFVDVKTPIMAGMGKLKNGQYITKLTKIGHEVHRHYFDTINKDCQVGTERIKRVITK